MKYMQLLLLFCGLLFATSAQAGNIQMMTDSIKKPITIEAKNSKLLNVVFNHTSHRGINCFTCHHMKSEAKGRYVPCSECHKNEGRSKEPLSMFKAAHSKMSAHSCYSCHTSLAQASPTRFGKQFYNCRPCHMAAKEPMKVKK